MRQNKNKWHKRIPGVVKNINSTEFRRYTINTTAAVYPYRHVPRLVPPGLRLCVLFCTAAVVEHVLFVNPVLSSTASFNRSNTSTCVRVRDARAADIKVWSCDYSCWERKKQFHMVWYVVVTKRRRGVRCPYAARKGAMKLGRYHILKVRTRHIDPINPNNSGKKKMKLGRDAEVDPNGIRSTSHFPWRRTYY